MVIAVLHDVKVRRCYLLVFALAFTTHVLNVFVFFLIGRNLEVVVSLEQWLFIVPSVLLFSMLPISAGGWGLREVSLIVALGGLGVRPEEAIIPSLMFGIGVLVAALQGGIVWLTNRKRTSVGIEERASHGQVYGSDPGEDGLVLGSSAQRGGGLREHRSK